MADASKIDYQTTTFTLKADHLGSNKATLLHARTTLNNSRRSYRAILYLHGYVDYFFQYEQRQHLILYSDDPLFLVVIMSVNNASSTVTISMHSIYANAADRSFRPTTMHTNTTVKVCRSTTKRLHWPSST